MIEKTLLILQNLDFVLWHYLNNIWTNSFLDTFVPYLRNQWTWAPLYLFLLLFMYLNYGKRGLLWCLFFLVTFGLSDQLSAHLFKEIFKRTRPCNDPQWSGIVHIIVPCGSGYSFPSSHAANHFSLGIFSALTLKHLGKWIMPLALIWAASVAYAQVYVGVHYPLDVFCGGILGVGVGCFTAYFFKMKISLAKTNTQLEVN